MKIKKILLIKLGGIGDMIFFTPVITSLRKKFPEAKIDVMVENKAVTEVLSGTDLINQFIYHNPKNEKISKMFNFFKFLFLLRKEKYDLSISSYPGKSFFASFMAGIINAKIKIGFNYKNKGLFYNIKIKLNESLHITDKNLSLIKPLNIRNIDKKYFFYIDDSGYKFAENLWKTYNLFSKKYILTFHCGSSLDWWGKSKQWSIKKYLKLFDKLYNNIDCQIIVLGSESEKFKVPDYVIELFGKTNIKELGAVIKKSDLFIGNDSGPLHIAAAVDCYTLSVWGATDSLKAAPRGKKHFVIKSDLECSPCSSIDNVKCLKPECLEQITVERVFTKIIKILLEKS